MKNAPMENLHKLGIHLSAPQPHADSLYIPFVRSGNLLFLSGQIAERDGEFICGRLGDDVTIEQGRQAAHWCALNLLAQLNAAVGGDFGRVVRVVRVGVFVASTPQFTQHSGIGNGVSQLLVDVFGDAGRHARTSIGVAALPLGVAVEADAVFELIDHVS
jgi:enamine deaminase RidA (YjgF/YER057c/UK114 family)